jgi:hypothetical protein
MKPLLIALFTTVFTLAGWQFGSTRHASQSRVVAVASQSHAIPASVPDANTPRPPTPPDVHAILKRLTAEFGDDMQMYEWYEFTARLYAELHDLHDDQFGEAIANLVAGHGYQGQEAGQLLAGWWAERDLPAARAWMVRLKGDGNGLGRAVFDVWRRSDAAGMIDWIKTHYDEIESKDVQAEARGAILVAAAKIDPEEGFRVLAMLNKGGVPAYQSTLYRFWARRDPEAAVARALREPNETERAEAILTCADEWGARDPAAARIWAEKLPDAVLSERALVRIGSRIGWKDAAACADFLTTIPQTNATREALQQNVSEWARGDLPAALGWAVTQDNQALGSSALARIAASVPIKRIERAIAALPPEQRAQAAQRWQTSRETESAESK